MYTKLLSVIAIIEIMWGTIFQFCILIVARPFQVLCKRLKLI